LTVKEYKINNVIFVCVKVFRHNFPPLFLFVLKSLCPRDSITSHYFFLGPSSAPSGAYSDCYSGKPFSQKSQNVSCFISKQTVFKKYPQKTVFSFRLSQWKQQRKLWWSQLPYPNMLLLLQGLHQWDSI